MCRGGHVDHAVAARSQGVVARQEPHHFFIHTNHDTFMHLALQFVWPGTCFKAT
jgi:hypothetical protein